MNKGLPKNTPSNNMDCWPFDKAVPKFIHAKDWFNLDDEIQDQAKKHYQEPIGSADSKFQHNADELPCMARRQAGLCDDQPQQGR